MHKSIVYQPVKELRVRMTSSLTVPDPAFIQTTGDWYYLDHVSSGLVFYDLAKKKFSPLFAESWTTNGGAHRFKLRSDNRFSDGTAITAKDVIWSIKRQLIKRTATHFPLWEYIVGCEGLKTLTDECDGLRAVSDSEIEIRLKTSNESFYLQLASPETGIWSADDMNPDTLELKPTKFSGAYSFVKIENDSALLQRNIHSPISHKFPEAPLSIRLFLIPAAKLNQSLTEGKIDLTIRPYTPRGEPEWSKTDIKTQASTMANMFYLYGLGSGDRPAIGRDFVEALWSANPDDKITAAESFLPFAKKFGLRRDEFLEQLPEKSARTVRIFCPEGFFAEAFLTQIKNAATSVGMNIEFSFAPAMEWFKAFEDPNAAEKYDYMLTLYAASERYPAVQLRYITNKTAKPNIDLKLAESPDIDLNRATILRDYQKWLLQTRFAIPLFFGSTLLLHRDNLDLGEQSETDAEIELWRVRERIK